KGLPPLARDALRLRLGRRLAPDLLERAAALAGRKAAQPLVARGALHRGSGAQPAGDRAPHLDREIAQPLGALRLAPGALGLARRLALGTHRGPGRARVDLALRARRPRRSERGERGDPDERDAAREP